MIPVVTISSRWAIFLSYVFISVLLPRRQHSCKFLRDRIRSNDQRYPGIGLDLSIDIGKQHAQQKFIRKSMYRQRKYRRPRYRCARVIEFKFLNSVILLFPSLRERIVVVSTLAASSKKQNVIVSEK